MEAYLVGADRIRELLNSKFLHTDLPHPAVNCCLIGDVFFQLERLKKNGHSMTEVLARTSEFDKAVGKGFALVAPLDSQALENGLIAWEDGEIDFFEPAIQKAKHPSDSVNIIAARDFDRTWCTEFLTNRI